MTRSTHHHFLLLIALVLSTATKTVSAFSVQTTSTASISDLLKEHSQSIEDLKSCAASVIPSPPRNDVFYLRYCLAEPDEEKRKARLTDTLEWRDNDGKLVCTAAEIAIGAAIGVGGRWINGPVRNSAPYAAKINQFITSSEIVTTTSSKDDLIFCIRAGQIDDTGLMSEVTKEEMVEYFLYCKEVNAQIADMRSVQLDKLVRVVIANDLYGIKIVGGSKDFRAALSEASNKANEMYPNLAGPTMLLNLPPLLGALVKLFKPLFPKEVRKKLMFKGGLMGKKVDDLKDVLHGGKGRDKFLEGVDKLLYTKGDW